MTLASLLTLSLSFFMCKTGLIRIAFCIVWIISSDLREVLAPCLHMVGTQSLINRSCLSKVTGTDSKKKWWFTEEGHPCGSENQGFLEKEGWTRCLKEMWMAEGRGRSVPGWKTGRHRGRVCSEFDLNMLLGGQLERWALLLRTGSALEKRAVSNAIPTCCNKP